MASSSRDYTYVDDIVDGIVAAYERAEGFRIYNLGGSRTTTLRELIEGLEAVLETKARIRQLPMQPGDVTRTWADVTAAGRDLGYRPATPLETGLQRFVSWFREQNAANPP